MSDSNAQFLDAKKTDEGILVRFLDRKVLNDHKMEVMAAELFRLAGSLGQRVLRLDFGNVEYLQSSVLGKLVSLQKKIGEAGGTLILCNVSAAVHRSFTVTKLDKLFKIEAAECDSPPSP